MIEVGVTYKDRATDDYVHTSLQAYIAGFLDFMEFEWRSNSRRKHSAAGAYMRSRPLRAIEARGITPDQQRKWIRDFTRYVKEVPEVVGPDEIDV